MYHFIAVCRLMAWRLFKYSYEILEILRMVGPAQRVDNFEIAILD